MGIFGALTTSVAGLRAGSYALENISGNIANSQTTAFKRIDTAFLDLIPQAGTNQQLAGSVKAQSRSTNTTQGSVEASSIGTYMAINGDGFFVVQKPGNVSDNNPVFTGVDYYTRRGDFSLNKNGFLVNGAGYFLEGIPIDRTTGNPVGSNASVLQFQNDFLPSQPTTQIQYRANLASYPRTSKADTTLPGSELLSPSSYTINHNPRVAGTPAPAFSDAVFTAPTPVNGSGQAAYTSVNGTPGAQLFSGSSIPASGATLLSALTTSGGAPQGIANGDTLTINGITITFQTGAGALAGAGAARTLGIDTSLTDFVAALNTLQGGGAGSTVTGGVIRLNTGTAADLAVTGSAGVLTALGLTAPSANTVARGGGGPTTPLISGTTKLSGSATPTTTVLSTAFAAGNTITVNSQTLTFVASGAVGPNQINITDDITTLLGKIDGLSGGTGSTVTGGRVRLHTGAASDLSISSSNTGALAALGLTNPTTQARNGGGTPGTGIVIGDDDATFQSESISGGAITAYDANGAPVNVQLRWAKVDNASLGAGHADTWNLFYQVDPNATGTQTAWQNVGTEFTFASGGQLNPPIGSITLTQLTVAGVNIGDVNLSFGKGGLTQFADTNGNVQVNQLQQDGFAAGQLQSVSVSNEGRVVGTYSNGRNIDLAQVAVATFNGANFLKRIDGGAFAVTNESGQALFGKGGTISGSSLEGSNVDIADEFTKLIVTQQAYSANTKVITTANTMVQDLLNVLR